MLRWLLLLLILAAPLAAAPNAFQLARTVAEQHYQLAESGNRPAWGATFARDHGDLSAMWLQSQQAKREGFKYTFGKSSSITDAKIVLMFTKRDPKGKPVGGCAITLVPQGGKWVVTEAGY